MKLGDSCDPFHKLKVSLPGFRVLVGAQGDVRQEESASAGAHTMSEHWIAHVVHLVGGVVLDELLVKSSEKPWRRECDSETGLVIDHVAVINRRISNVAFILVLWLIRP